MLSFSQFVRWVPHLTDFIEMQRMEKIYNPEKSLYVISFNIFETKQKKNIAGAQNSPAILKHLLRTGREVATTKPNPDMFKFMDLWIIVKVPSQPWIPPLRFRRP